MSAENAIKKLQKVAKEKEVQKNENRQKQGEEMELLRKKEAKENTNRKPPFFN